MYLQHSAQVCCTDKSSLQWHFLHLHLQYYTEYSQWLVTISVSHKPNYCSSSFLVHCSPVGGLRFQITTCDKTFSLSFRSTSAIVLHQVSSRVPWAQLYLLNCPWQVCTQFQCWLKARDTQYRRVAPCSLTSRVLEISSMRPLAKRDWWTHICIPGI